jgi:hypothetical protein
MLPALVISPIARIAIVGALVAAFGLTCWLRGAAHAERKAEALRAVEERATYRRLQELAKRAEEVTLVYLARRDEIDTKARTIEVTKYVTQKSDAACPVPVGLVRLWDAQSMPAAIYQPDSGDEEAARDLALSYVGRGIVEARRRFEVNKSRCEALQAWARGFE